MLAHDNMGQNSSSRLLQPNGIHHQHQTGDKTQVNGHGHIYSLVKGEKDRNSQKTLKPKTLKKEKAKENKKDGCKSKSKTELCRNIARYDSSRFSLLKDKKRDKSEKDVKEKGDSKEQLERVEDKVDQKKENKNSRVPDGNEMPKFRTTSKRFNNNEKNNVKPRSGNIEHLNKQFEDFVTKLRKEAGTSPTVDASVEKVGKEFFLSC